MKNRQIIEIIKKYKGYQQEILYAEPPLSIDITNNTVNVPTLEQKTEFTNKIIEEFEKWLDENIRESEV